MVVQRFSRLHQRPTTHQRLPEPARIRIGTASWADPGFIADWYPKDLPAEERLPWYAGHFDLVEVNTTFYGIPATATVERWCEQTPADFLFDVKLHRLLSRHSTPANLLPRGVRKLAGNSTGRVKLTPALEKAVTEIFLEGIEPLAQAGKLGALLLQLSPPFRPRTNRLEELDQLVELLEGYRLAVELRNREWLDKEQLRRTLAYFKSRRITFVTVDAPLDPHFMVMPNLDVVTTPELAYLRAHGRNASGYVRGRTVAERFDHDYSTPELKEIAGRVTELAEAVREVHVIYNNNKSSYAPEAAERFRKIVERRAARLSAAR